MVVKLDRVAADLLTVTHTEQLRNGTTQTSVNDLTDPAHLVWRRNTLDILTRPGGELADAALDLAPEMIKQIAQMKEGPLLETRAVAHAAELARTALENAAANPDFSLEDVTQGYEIVLGLVQENQDNQDNVLSPLTVELMRPIVKQMQDQAALIGAKGEAGRQEIAAQRPEPKKWPLDGYAFK